MAQAIARTPIQHIETMATSSLFLPSMSARVPIVPTSRAHLESRTRSLQPLESSATIVKLLLGSNLTPVDPGRYSSAVNMLKDKNFRSHPPQHSDTAHPLLPGSHTQNR
jgi:hypothetical protein